MKKTAQKKVKNPGIKKAPARIIKAADIRRQATPKPVKTGAKPVVQPVPPPEPDIKKKPVIRLSQKVLDDFKEMLVTMRQRITGQIASLKGDSLQREDAVNSEEDGTDAFERQFALNIASSENEVVFEIDEALSRIEQGTYGICEQCRSAIEIDRLKALPFVKMCIKCKAENEKGTLKYRPLPEIERP